MQIKYDWLQLKHEFIHGQWLSLSSFLQAKKIKNTGYIRSKMVGWIKSKQEYRTDLLQKATEVLEDKAVEAQKRQLRLARQMQTKGTKGLEYLEIEDIDDARKLLNDGILLERQTLGMDKKQDVSNVTQINL